MKPMIARWVHVDGQDFEVIVDPVEDGGFTVGCVELLGCWSQGATETEALVNIADAIHEYRLALLDLKRRAENSR